MPETTLRPGDSVAAPRHSDSVECRRSWIAASFALALLAVCYGAPLLVVVGLKPIQASLGSDRSVIALAGALVWVGTGLGGIMMGWLADRIGIRTTIALGAVMMAVGLALSATGSLWALFVGHGVFIGLLGNAAFYAPLLVYVSRWFDRRRGTALALISSGQYISGMVWPSVFERGIERFGWQASMLGYAVVTVVLILPIAVFGLAPAPEPLPAARPSGGTTQVPQVLGLPPNMAQALLCLAGFLCCIPMALPSAHLVAFCSDLGIAPAQGAAMLSVMLGCAFVSRQFWGWFGDRYGGLRAVLAGSTCQAAAIACFLLTQNEAGLFAVAAAYGLGFSGIIPSYVLAVRALFPSSEAAWRVPTLLFTSMGGMAAGSWLGGALYDHFGNYAAAFGSGVVFNLANIVVVGLLVLRQQRGRHLQFAAAE
jgi:MFS family permease